MLQDLWTSCILDQKWCLVLLTTLPCEYGQELGKLLLILSFPAVQVKGHRITEYPGLEETHQDRRVQLLALHRHSNNPSLCLKELSQCSWSSGSLGALTIPWGACSSWSSAFGLSILLPSHHPLLLSQLCLSTEIQWGDCFWAQARLFSQKFAFTS